MKKRFFVRLICFFLALLVIPVGYFAAVQSLPAMFRGSLMGSVYVKQQLVQDTPGERILVVGGSSVPYSIQCEQVAEAVEMPCIALGATAYLGLEYYLALIDDELHPGDIVILAPEFAMLQNAVSYSTTWMAVENSPSLLAALPVSYWPGMVSSYYTYSRQKLDLLRQKGAPTTTAQEQYTAFGFGPWGDIVTERESMLENGYDKNNILTLDDSSLSDEVVKAVRRFAKKAQKAGATVVLTWAPFDTLAYTGTAQQLEEFQTQLESRTGLPYVGCLTECMLPAELFYDSNNHLTTEGAELRTRMLLDDLAESGILS